MTTSTTPPTTTRGETNTTTTTGTENCSDTKEHGGGVGVDGGGGGGENDTTWTLCLTAPQGRPQRVIVTVSAATTTVQQLHEMAAAAFFPTLRTTTGKSSSSSSNSSAAIMCVQLQFGFPLQTLDAASNSPDTVTLASVGIRNQERIVVTEAAVTTATVSAASPNVPLQLPPLEKPKHQRSRRKAAIAATEAMVAANAANNANAAESSSAAASSKPTRRKKAATDSSSSANRHFAALARKSKSAGGGGGGGSAAGGADAAGRRLRDGAAILEPAKKKKRARNISAAASAATTTDLPEALVGMATSSNNQSAGARLMRRGWRQAVVSAYEQNRAACRVAAAQALEKVTFAIISDPNEDQQQQQLNVTYPKGVQGRGNFDDAVDYLEQEVLVTAIQAIHPAEALRSSNLALLSPRVFWSLLYHYSSSFSSTTTTTMMEQNRGDVVHHALQWSCPELDWSFLRRRPQQLSAKARENLQQKQQQQSASSSGTEEDWEAAAAAIAAVEQAMEDMPSFVLSSGNNRSTTNGPDSSDTAAGSGDWCVVTPSDEDLDELKECILSYQYDASEGTAMAGQYYYALPDVVEALRQDLQVHNWRELANVGIAAIVCEQVLEALRKRQSSEPAAAALPLGDDDMAAPANKQNNAAVPVSVAAVEAWLEHAQLQSMEEIMVEICEGNVQAVEVLRDAARSGTPKDLAVWQSIVGTLYQQVVTSAAADATDSDGAEVFTPDLPALQRWCDRARQAIEQFEWLNWYATPIY